MPARKSGRKSNEFDLRAWFAQFVADHLALVTTSATLTLVVLRLAAVSQFDADKAQAFASSSSPWAVLVGTLVAYVPFWFGLALIVGLAGSRFIDNQWQWSVRIGLSGTLLLLIGSVPWMSAAIMGLVILLSIHLFKGEREGWLGRVARGTILGYGVSIVLTFLTSETPWVPLEALVMKHGTEVGYVLRNESGWVTVLDEDDAILIYRDSEVQRRYLCTRLRIPGGDASIPDLLAGRPQTVRKCPDA